MPSGTQPNAKRSARPIGVLLLPLLSSLPGCYLQRTYQVDAPVAEQITAKTAPPTVVALREGDQRPVTIKTSTVLRDSVRATSDTRAVVTTRALGKMTTAGIVLTFAGTALSLVGSGLFFGTSGTTRIVGAVLAGSGEAPMISGSVLWVLGLRRYPAETAAQK